MRCPLLLPQPRPQCRSRRPPNCHGACSPRCTAQISVTSGGGSRRRIGCRWAPRPQRWWSLDKAAEAGSQPPLPPRRPRWRLRAFSRAAPEANVLACAQPAHIGPGAPAGGLGQAVHIAGEQHLGAACLVGKTASRTAKRRVRRQCVQLGAHAVLCAPACAHSPALASPGLHVPAFHISAHAPPHHPSPPWHSRAATTRSPPRFASSPVHPLGSATIGGQFARGGGCTLSMWRTWS